MEGCRTERAGEEAGWSRPRGATLPPGASHPTCCFFAGTRTAGVAAKPHPNWRSRCTAGCRCCWRCWFECGDGGCVRRLPRPAGDSGDEADAAWKMRGGGASLQRWNRERSEGYRSAIQKSSGESGGRREGAQGHHFHQGASYAETRPPTGARPAEPEIGNQTWIRIVKLKRTSCF